MTGHRTCNKTKRQHTSDEEVHIHIETYFIYRSGTCVVQQRTQHGLGVLNHFETFAFASFQSVRSDQMLAKFGIAGVQKCRIGLNFAPTIQSLLIALTNETGQNESPCKEKFEKKYLKRLFQKPRKTGTPSTEPTRLLYQLPSVGGRNLNSPKRRVPPFTCWKRRVAGKTAECAFGHVRRIWSFNTLPPSRRCGWETGKKKMNGWFGSNYVMFWVFTCNISPAFKPDK